MFCRKWSELSENKKTAEQIDGFIDKLIAVEGDEDKELVEFLFKLRCDVLKDRVI